MGAQDQYDGLLDSFLGSAGPAPQAPAPVAPPAPGGAASLGLTARPPIPGPAAPSLSLSLSPVAAPAPPRPVAATPKPIQADEPNDLLNSFLGIDPAAKLMASAPSVQSTTPDPSAPRQGEGPDQYLERQKLRNVGDFSAGLAGGIQSVKQLGYGALAAGADAIGADGIKDWSLKGYREAEEAARPYQEGRPTTLEQIKISESGGIGRAVDWAQYQFGNLLPSIAETIVAGAVGAGIGSAAPGAGTLAGAAAGAVEKGLVKKWVAGRVEDYVAKQVATKGLATMGADEAAALKAAAEASAHKLVARDIGARLGMFAASYEMGLGDVYGETLDKSKTDGNAGSAFLVALPYAALDALTEIGILNRIGRGVGADSLAKFAGAIAKETGTTALKEGATEAGQEALLMLAGANEGKTYTSDQVLSRLANSAAAGAVGGGGMGVFSGASRALQPVDHMADAPDVLRTPGDGTPQNDLARALAAAEHVKTLRATDPRAADQLQRAYTDVIARGTAVQPSQQTEATPNATPQANPQDQGPAPAPPVAPMGGSGSGEGAAMGADMPGPGAIDVGVSGPVAAPKGPLAAAADAFLNTQPPPTVAPEVQSAAPTTTPDPASLVSGPVPLGAAGETNAPTATPDAIATPAAPSGAAEVDGELFNRQARRHAGDLSRAISDPNGRMKGLLFHSFERKLIDDLRVNPSLHFIDRPDGGALMVGVLNPDTGQWVGDPRPTEPPHGAAAGLTPLGDMPLPPTTGPWAPKDQATPAPTGPTSTPNGEQSNGQEDQGRRQAGLLEPQAGSVTAPPQPINEDQNAEQATAPVADPAPRAPAPEARPAVAPEANPSAESATSAGAGAAPVVADGLIPIKTTDGATFHVRGDHYADPERNLLPAFHPDGKPVKGRDGVIDRGYIDPASAPAMPAAKPPTQAPAKSAATPSTATGAHPLATVTDVYGDEHRVRQDHLDNQGREQLPIFDSKGNRRIGKTLHRGNIAADPSTIPTVKTKGELRAMGYQIRRGPRSDKQEGALLQGGFRPVLLDGGEFRHDRGGVWAKPKAGEWGADILSGKAAEPATQAPQPASHPAAEKAPTPPVMPPGVKRHLDAMLSPLRDGSEGLSIARKTMANDDGRYGGEYADSREADWSERKKRIADKIASIPDPDKRAVAQAYVDANMPNLSLTEKERGWMRSAAAPTPTPDPTEVRGDGAGEATKPMRSHGWDAVKLADAYSFDDLNRLRAQVESDHTNQKDASGHPLESGRPSIHLYDKVGRKKLDAIAWAVSYKLQKQKTQRAESVEPERKSEPVREESARPSPAPVPAAEIPAKAPAPIQMTMAEWRKIHRDFKGRADDGTRMVMREGGMVAVEIVGAEKLAAKPETSEPIPAAFYALREMEKRADRKPHNPGILTAEAIQALRDAGLVSPRSRLARMTDVGRAMLNEWRREVTNRELAQASADDERIDRETAAERAGKAPEPTPASDVDSKLKSLYGSDQMVRDAVDREWTDLRQKMMPDLMRAERRWYNLGADEGLAAAVKDWIAGRSDAPTRLHGDANGKPYADVSSNSKFSMLKRRATRIAKDTGHAVAVMRDTLGDHGFLVELPVSRVDGPGVGTEPDIQGYDYVWYASPAQGNVTPTQLDKLNGEFSAITTDVAKRSLVERVAPDAPAAKPETPAITPTELERVGMLREHRGKWQYRTAGRDGALGNWLTSNDKAGAVEMATKLYSQTPQADRMGREERDDKAAADEAVAKSDVAARKKADEKARADAGVDSFGLSVVETSPEAQKAADEGQTGFRFSLTTPTTKPTTPPPSATLLNARLQPLLRSQLGLASLVDVRVEQSESALPPSARAKLAIERQTNPGAMPKALFVPGKNGGKGTIILIADNLASPKDAILTLFAHEGFHSGVRYVLDSALNPFLDELIADRSSDISEWSGVRNLDALSEEKRREVAEEFLAHLAERNYGRDQSFLERVYQAIRAALRPILAKMGYHLRLSDGDLREFVTSVARYNRTGSAADALATRERWAVRGKEGGRAGGERFSFAGKGAKTADLHALDTARARLDAGEDSETVRRDTGWHKGVDGKWRFEISDSDARFLPANDDSVGKRWTKTLAETLDHPALFSAYPALRDISVKSVIGLDSEGTYDRKTGEIEINASRRESDQLSTLLHEIQHGIQSIEGFATGGSSSNLFTGQMILEFPRIAKNISWISRDLIKDVESIIPEQSALPDLVRNLNDIQQQIKLLGWNDLRRDELIKESSRLNIKIGGIEGNLSGLNHRISKALSHEGRKYIYRRLGGEVESRNAQARQRLTAAERANTPPSATQDVPDSDVIVTFNGKDMANAPRPANAQPVRNPDEFNESAYRPAVVAWAKARFGDQRAPDGGLAWGRFVEWFGDSKAVGKNGEPRTYYHGTPHDISIFETKRKSLNGGIYGNEEVVRHGIFFTSNIYYSEAFANKEETGGSIIPVYLRVSRPLMINADNAEDIGLTDDAIDSVRSGNEWEIFDDEAGQSSVDAIRSAGYDGVSYWEKDEVSYDTPQEVPVIVVFDSSQAKSAIGNNGAFSPASPDIRFSLSRPDLTMDRLKSLGAGGLEIARAFSIGKTPQTLGERWNSITSDWKRQAIKGVFDSFVAYKDTFPKAYMLLRMASSASQQLTAMMDTQGGLPFMRADGSRGVHYDADKGGFINDLVNLKGEHQLWFAWLGASRSDQIVKEAQAAKRKAESLKVKIAELRIKAEIARRDAQPEPIGVDRLARVKEIDKQLTDLSKQYAAEVKRSQVTERNLKPEGIAAGLTLNQGKMADGRDRATVYNETKDRFDAFENAVLDISEAAGDIDPESRRAWKRDFYVNFARDLGDREFNPNIGGAIIHGSPIHRMKGGVDATNDLLQNTLNNWGALLSSAARNRAGVEALTAMSAPGVGMAVKIAPRVAEKMGIADKQKLGHVRIGGKETYFQVADQAYLEALQSLEPQSLTGPLADAMRGFKRILTVSVTMAPAFKFWRNPIRDAVTSIAVAPLSYNVAGNLKRGWDAQMDPKTRIGFLASGAMFHMGSSFEGEGTHWKGTPWESTQADRLSKEIDRMNADPTTLNTKEKLLAQLTKWGRAYQDIGDAVENVQRAALHEKRITEVGNLQADYEARDVMDFGLTGAWPAVRALTSMVPFMNARLQGIYKLGRAGHADPKRMFTVLAATTMAGLALALMYRDDEDWKRREDWDRETYFWFKVGDTAFRLPKSFEIGAVGTIIENGMSMFWDDEMTGKRFRDRTLEILSNQLSMNPTPQIIKPMIDVYANKNGFTGAPIESLAMQRLLPQDRYTERSSEIARGVSRGLNAVAGSVDASSLSPVQIDALIAGYLGWAGTMTALAVDQMARPVLGRPARPSLPQRFWGGVTEDLKNDPAQSRYLTQFYDQGRQLQQAYASWQAAGKVGDMARREALTKRYGESLPADARRALCQQKTLTALGAQRRTLMQGPGDSATKARALFQINAKMDAVAQGIGPLLE